MVSFRTKIKVRNALSRFNRFVGQKYLYAIVIIALLVALGGSFTGLSTYVYTASKSADELTACSGDLNSTKISYAECLDKSASLSSSLQSSQIDLTACQNRITTDLSTCLSDKQNLLTENKETADSLTSCKITQSETNVTLMTISLQNKEIMSDFSAIVQNSASTICCMKNAALKGLGMNTSYSYYYVLNNTIVCTDHSDPSLGTAAIIC